MAEASRSDVRGIQYLRGVAALAVVLYHICKRYGLGFDLGAAGVDLFFVISGFIMWITTDGLEIAPADFIARRITRVVPLYWVVTFVTAAGIAVRPAFFFGHDGSLTNIIGSLFFVPKLDDGFAPVALQGWTLCYEMFFYAIFALVLGVPRRFRLPSLVLAMLAILAGRVLIHGYVAVYMSPLMLEFAAGTAVGVAWATGKRIPFVVAIGMAAAGCAWFALIPSPIGDVEEVMRWGPPATLLVAGVVFFERERGLRDIRWMHFLGDASYSIYLWHVVAIVIVSLGLIRLGTPRNIMPFLILPGAIALVLLAYRWVELPLNALFRVKRKETIAANAP